MMNAAFSAEQRARIEQWVAQQLAQPWPLSCTQLDLIRRSLTSRRHAADNTPRHTAIRTNVTGGAA